MRTGLASAKRKGPTGEIQLRPTPTEERILLAPYNGSDRYPSYTRQVERLPVQAYLVRLGLISAGQSTAADLARTLLDPEKMGGTGPAFSRFGELLRAATVLDRRAIGSWDVWIVEMRNAK